MYTLLLITCLCSLSEEVDTFLDAYRFNGYTYQWSKSLYLPVGEPLTVFIYPGNNLEGVLCGVGGKDLLDLHLELQGGGLNIIDGERDDLPVLRFATGDETVAYKVTVTALDMIHGATADSAYIFFALKPVINELNNTAPAEPDLAITGD